MTLEEIKLVEQRLDIKLPDIYKAFQLYYPKQLVELKFNYEYFTTDLNYLIQTNEMFRAAGLPKEYLVIGNDIGGNYFFIKTNEADSSVYYLDHEEASEKEDGTESTWEEVLKVNNENLTEFSEWLVGFWGGVL